MTILSIIDLTAPLGPETMVYPGDPMFTMSVLNQNDKVRVEHVSMGTHTGTHVDFPLHLFPQGISADQVDANKLVCQVYFLDFAPLHADQRLATLRKLAKCIGGKGLILRTCPGEVCLSGGLTADEAHIIADSGAALVGVDALSVEEAETLPAHRILLSHGVLIVEGLCNLNTLENGCEYLLFVGAIKLVGAGGAPARVLAVKP